MVAMRAKEDIENLSRARSLSSSWTSDALMPEFLESELDWKVFNLIVVSKLSDKPGSIQLLEGINHYGRCILFALNIDPLKGNKRGRSILRSIIQSNAEEVDLRVAIALFV